jgi:MFS family permease
LATLYVFSLIDRFVIALLIEPLKAELHITDTQVGLLIGPAFVFWYASLGLAIAWLVDRGNRIWVAAAGIVIWSLSTIASGYANSFPTLLILRMNVALGEAALIPAAVSIIADIFARHERATPTAVFVCAGGIGTVATYALGSSVLRMIHDGLLQSWPVIGGLAEWRATFVLVGAPALLLGLLLLFSVRDPARRHGREMPDDAAQGAGVFRTPREGAMFYTLYFLGTAFLTMTVTGVYAWYPTYLVRTFGISISTAGYILTPAVALPPIVGVVIPIVAERWNRRTRGNSLIPIQLGAMVLGFAVLTAAMSQQVMHTAIALLTVGYSFVGGTNGLYTVIVGLTAPSAYRARITAIGVAIVSGVGMGVGPFLVGAMAEHFLSRTLGGALLALVIVTGPLSCAFIFWSWRRLHAFQAGTT